MEPIIITAAGTGGKWTKDDSPYVPLTPQEIVEDAVRCFEAGAVMFHVHARTEEGVPTFEPIYFEEIITPMRERCPGVIIQMSTGRMEGQVGEKLEPLMRLRPDLASFNMKGSQQETLLMAEIMEKYSVKPALECFSFEMLEKVKELQQKGILQAPIFLECVFELGDSGESYAQKARNLLSFVEAFPSEFVWSQTRGGPDSKALQTMAIAMGGHVRTGLEDNLYARPGFLAQSSAELIASAVNIARELGRKVATVQEARQILKIQRA